MSATFRRALYALVPTVLLFGGVELALRVSGFTPVTAAEQAATRGFYGGAYVHRRDMEARPWFVVDGAQARSNPRLVPRGFHDQTVPVAVPDGERRVFALGGSTTQGAPYEDRTRGFPQLLEAELAAGGGAWRVVNAGVAGLDSSRFPELAREAVALGATDLVVYAGHNEISGRLIDRCLAPQQMGLARVVDRVRTLRVLLVWAERMRGAPPPSAESLRQHQDDCMEAALDRALAETPPGPGPQRADAVAQDTVRGFARALAEVADVAEAAGVPVWVGRPVGNLRAAPVAPRVNAGLAAEPARVVAAVWRQAQVGAVEPAALDAAIAQDPTHAGLRWARGMASVAADPDAARLDLQAAVDWDYQGTRVTAPLVAVVDALCAARAGVHCVDVAAAFETAAGGAVPDEALFVDHCHPTWEGGTPLISAAFAQQIRGESP
jgi:hypothetical protein